MNAPSKPPKPKKILVKARPALSVLPEPPRLAEVAAPAWFEDQPLRCPVNKSHAFARVPSLKLRGRALFPPGTIQLRYGAHYGPNHGFGFLHIWREHFNHIRDHDEAMRKVKASIANILKAGTAIRHDTNATATRVFVVRIGAGIVVVEHLKDEGFPAIYSVVTGGYHPRENTKGSVIGALV